MNCVDLRRSREEREGIFNASTTHEMQCLSLAGRVALERLLENSLWARLSRVFGSLDESFALHMDVDGVLNP